MRDLKYIGAMIDGHTNGPYPDHLSLCSLRERVEALGAPIAQDSRADICVNTAKTSFGI